MKTVSDGKTGSGYIYAMLKNRGAAVLDAVFGTLHIIGTENILSDRAYLFYIFSFHKIFSFIIPVLT